METTSHSIIHADPHALVRQALGKLMPSWGRYKLIAETTSAEETLSSVEQHNPAVLILELALPGPSGIEVLQELRRRKHKVRTLVASSLDSDHLVRCALKAGALGYVPKWCSLDEFSAGLQSVVENKTYLPERLSHLRGTQLGDGREEELLDDPLAPLSTREREIFHLLASGLQNSVIAKKLFISPRTVETHRARVVRKLGLCSNSELIRFAIKHGLSVL